MLKSWGLPQGRPVGLAVALTNFWSQPAKYAFPVVALAALAAEGGKNQTLDVVALIALIILIAIVAGFAAGLSSKRLATTVGDTAARGATWLKRLIRRRPVGWGGAEFVRFRSEALDLLRRRWHVLTIATIVSQLAVFVVLVVALRAVGVTRVRVRLSRHSPPGPGPRCSARSRSHPEARHRGARAERSPRRLRGGQRGGSRRDAHLPLPHRRAHPLARPARGRNLQAREADSGVGSHDYVCSA